MVVTRKTPEETQSSKDHLSVTLTCPAISIAMGPVLWTQA